ncbi:MAG: hypothetical protein U0791_26460 [Gemmataceae bacterium]
MPAEPDVVLMNPDGEPLDSETMRRRSRYEADNNPYFKGSIREIVGDSVGGGPPIEFIRLDGGPVEKQWLDWIDTIDTRGKLVVLPDGFEVRQMTPEECAGFGLDWNEVIEQRKREGEIAKQYGLPPPLQDCGN